MAYSKPNTHSVPNELCDKHMKQLNGSEFKVLYLIARKTCGFHKDVEAMSTGRICLYTGLTADTVRLAVKALGELGLVNVERQYDEATQTYGENLYSLAVEEDTPLPRFSGEGTPKIGVGVPRKSGEGYPDFPVPIIGTNETVTNETDINETEETHTRAPQPQSQNQNPNHGGVRYTPLPEDDGDSDHQGSRGSSWQKEIRKSRQEQAKAAKRETKRQENLRFSQRFRDLEQTSRSRSEAPPATRGLQDSPPPPSGPAQPSAASVVRSCIDAWNSHFPDRQVDPAIYDGGTGTPYTLRDGTLHAQIGKVCDKVQTLIDAGADVTFGDLLRKDSGGGYRWQMVLAGGLDWMTKPKPKTKADKKEEFNAFIERARRENAAALERIEREKLEAAAAERARSESAKTTDGPSPSPRVP